jgi:nitrate/nitrite transport system substrate-binding protein
VFAKRPENRQLAAGGKCVRISHLTVGRHELMRGQVFEFTFNSSDKSMAPMQQFVSRRRFLESSFATSLGTLALVGCNSSSAPDASKIYAGTSSEAPEVSKVTFGVIALTDCSPILIAHEKGFFKEFGIESVITKPAGWKPVQEALMKGDTQGTHILIGMPVGGAVGLGGKVEKMVIPWLLNRNGQGITLKNKFKGKVAADPKALKLFVDESKATKKLTFAMTFPIGTHAMWLRYYLAAGGINPISDVEVITIPPPQMVANMKADTMDGFCVGEPWNARAIADDIGYTSITTQEIWKNHPEKGLAFTAEFAEQNPKAVKAVLKAVHKASVWLDDFSNRPEQCDIVSREKYINCPKEIILGRLQGKIDYGDGRKVEDTDSCMYFSKNNCNYPQPAYIKWWLTQMRRWGFLEKAPDYDAVAKQIMRTDLYEEAMKEIDYSHAGLDNSPWTMFDGVTFDPSGDMEAYAKSFAVQTVKDA